MSFITLPNDVVLDPFYIRAVGYIRDLEENGFCFDYLIDGVTWTYNDSNLKRTEKAHAQLLECLRRKR